MEQRATQIELFSMNIFKERCPDKGGKTIMGNASRDKSREFRLPISSLFITFWKTLSLHTNSPFGCRDWPVPTFHHQAIVDSWEAKS